LQTPRYCNVAGRLIFVPLVEAEGLPIKSIGNRRNRSISPTRY
jgi:hypothetical protein